MNERLKRYWGDFLNPLKNVGKYYKEEVDSGLHGMGVGEHETGLGSKALGLLQFAGAPVTALSRGLLEEPLEGNLVSAGVNPDVAEKIGLYTGLGASMIVPGAAATKIGRAITPRSGDLALTQQITRLAPGHKLSYEKGGTRAQDWYKGGQVAQLAVGAGRAVKDYAQMAFSPKKAHLFKKYGLSPSQTRDLKEQLDILSKLKNNEDVFKTNIYGRTDEFYEPSTGKWIKGKDPEKVDESAVKQEFHSTLAYIDSIFQKYMPNDIRRKNFLEDMYGHIFPRTAHTNYNSLVSVKDVEPVRKVLDNLPSHVTDDMIKEVINPAIAAFTRKGQKSGGNVALNSKRLWGNPFQDLSFKAKDNPLVNAPKGTGLYQVNKLWRDFPGDEVTKKNLIDHAKQNNLNIIAQYGDDIPKNVRKELYDIDSLKKSITQHDEFISISGEILSRDRLLAHIQNRLIIPRSGNDGMWTTIDHMAQGIPKKVKGIKIPFARQLENLTEKGSQTNVIVVDAFPVARNPKLTTATKRRKTGESIVSKQMAPKEQTFDELIESIGRKVSDPVPADMVKRFYGRRAKGLGLGLAGTGVAEGQRRKFTDAY